MMNTYLVIMVIRLITSFNFAFKAGKIYVVVKRIKKPLGLKYIAVVGIKGNHKENSEENCHA